MVSIFVIVDGGGYEYEIGVDEFMNKGKRDGGSFINDDKFSLVKNMRIFGGDVLDGLLVILEDVDFYNSFFEVGVCVLYDIIINVFFVI